MYNETWLHAIKSTKKAIVKESFHCLMVLFWNIPPALKIL